mmetsp:Transcript_4738/g.11121  ORF Transcript_4738/g.11121 Transcript_4738/m.11121 type:complete len:229 (+) Transcript_4738:177-863(+)
MRNAPRLVLVVFELHKHVTPGGPVLHWFANAPTVKGSRVRKNRKHSVALVEGVRPDLPHGAEPDNLALPLDADPLVGVVLVGHVEFAAPRVAPDHRGKNPARFFARYLDLGRHLLALFRTTNRRVSGCCGPSRGSGGWLGPLGGGLQAKRLARGPLVEIQEHADDLFFVHAFGLEFEVPSHGDRKLVASQARGDGDVVLPDIIVQDGLLELAEVHIQIWRIPRRCHGP